MSIRLDSIGQPRLTELLQNYPNPFNPETWIPYHLAHDADVQLTIYDAQGVVVRQLDLGISGRGITQTGAGQPIGTGATNWGRRWRVVSISISCKQGIILRCGRWSFLNDD